MRRIVLHRWVNTLAFALVLGLLITGVVLRWVLPPGGSCCRGQWREIHLVLALSFVGVLAVHLVLHRAWIRASLRPARDAAARRRPASEHPSRRAVTRSPARAIEDFLEGTVNCAACETKLCYEGTDCTGEGEEAVALYQRSDDRRMHAEAARVEAEGYGRLCRVEELLRFCDGLGIRRVGIAFCIGLAEEARILAELLAPHLEVSSVCCKVGAIPKEDLELQKIDHTRLEVACNPIGQAEILAAAGSELNLVVGLCLGHDILFTRHSKAPVTTLVVKDRALGHNPAVALYSSYHRKRLSAMGGSNDG